MSAERLQRLETLAAEHGQQFRGVFVVLKEVSETMKAFGAGIVELREGQSELQRRQEIFQRELDELSSSLQSVIEAQRITQQSVERLATTVSDLAQEAAQKRRIWQAESRQIWEYLLRERGNGRSE